MDKELVLIVLTIPLSTSIDGESKRNYEQGFHASLITLKVGSQGMPYTPGFCALKEELKLPMSSLQKLFANTIKVAIDFPEK